MADGDMRIALDIDDVILDFRRWFMEWYRLDEMPEDPIITKLVYRLRKNRGFWENLPLLERPDFVPCLYATKRINDKEYTKENLYMHSLPIIPIYQIYTQTGSKAMRIKGRCDVLIDDSEFNCIDAIKNGLAAILIERPHNVNSSFPYKINRLSHELIREVYDNEVKELTGT